MLDAVTRVQVKSLNETLSSRSISILTKQFHFKNEHENLEEKMIYV